MNIIKKIKTVLLVAFVVFEVVMLNIPTAAALIFGGGGSVIGAIKQIEERYHIDPESMKGFGEQLNVANNKGFAPEVRILFSPQDPKPGNKITARAFSQFFSNTTDSLYFTWYLKRKRCENDGTAFAEINNTAVSASEIGASNTCDHDGDGEYGINDWKIEAARVLAGGGFDVRHTERGSGDSDRDGYVAFPGGDNKRGAIAGFNPYYYYLHDFNSGVNYEIVDEIDNDAIFDCGNTGIAVCIDNQNLMCSSKQLLENVAKHMKTEEIVGGGGGGSFGEDSGSISISDNSGGDQSPTIELNTSANQSFQEFSYCGVVGTPQCKSKYEQKNSYNTDSDDESLNKLDDYAVPYCFGNATPVCVDKDSLKYSISDLVERSKSASAEWEYSFSDKPLNIPADGKFTEFQCSDVDVRSLVSFYPPPGDAIVDPVAALSQEIVVGKREQFVLSDYYSCDAELYGRSYNDKVTIDSNVVAERTVNSDGKNISGLKVLTSCTTQNITADEIQRFHLFPRDDDKKQVGSSSNPGFPEDDELFYHTDPFDKDTSDNRTDDEATVVGLGQDYFSWIYTPGDEVGVIVEGTSMVATKHPDSSNMIMFATVNNSCDYSGLVNNSVPTQTGSYQVRIHGYDVDIPAISTEGNIEDALNECLERAGNAPLGSQSRSLIDPAQGGAAKQLNVDLTYSPDNPINDSTPTNISGEDQSYINMGDTVSVSASVTNASYGSERLKYTWSIYKSNDGSADFDPENWNIIAGQDAHSVIGNGPFEDISPLVGNDLSHISFGLNLPGDMFPHGQDYTYIKARVYVEEDFDLLAQELHQYDISRGRSDVIFRISKASNTIKIYAMQTADQAMSDESNVGGIEMCNDIPGQLIKCPVIKNQVLRLFVDKDAGGSAAQYDNFRWRVNGKELNRPTSLGNCAPGIGDHQESVCNYMAVTGDSGNEYNVSVSAVDVNSGKAIELNRRLIVVDPYIAFCSSPNASEDGGAQVVGCSDLTRKEIGMYESDNGSEMQYSDKVFLASPGGESAAGGSIRPRWIEDQVVTNWFVNDILGASGGYAVSVDGSMRNLGDSINISSQSIYEQDESIRKLLRDVWSLTDRDLQKVYFDNHMQIEYTDMEYVAILSAPQAFMAAISINSPGTVLFLFRIFATVGIAVFFVGILWRISSTRSRL